MLVVFMDALPGVSWQLVEGHVLLHLLVLERQHQLPVGKGCGHMGSNKRGGGVQNKLDPEVMNVVYTERQGIYR